jgi:hypothetical protein
MRRNKLLVLAGLILLLSFPTFLKAQSEETQPPEELKVSAEETQYTNESVGHVSFIVGKSFIQRAADVGYEEVVLNDPVAEGDRIETADGRLEIRLDSELLRLMAKQDGGLSLPNNTVT